MRSFDDNPSSATGERSKYDMNKFKEMRSIQYNSTIVEEYNEDESFDLNQHKTSSVPRATEKYDQAYTSIKSDLSKYIFIAI